MRHGIALLALAGVAAIASAQPAATVTTTVHGAASATISPGGSVHVEVKIAHNGAMVAGIFGGSVITDNAGTPSGFFTTIPTIAAIPLASLGYFVGGSRVGADINNPPPGFPTLLYPFYTNPMPVWEYDLALSDPGVYSIIWVSPAATPNIRLYPSLVSVSVVEAQTTYVGATITVTPTPSATAIIAICGVVARRGRRVSLSGGQH